MISIKPNAGVCERAGQSTRVVIAASPVADRRGAAPPVHSEHRRAFPSSNGGYTNQAWFGKASKSSAPRSGAAIGSGLKSVRDSSPIAAFAKPNSRSASGEARLTTDAPAAAWRRPRWRSEESRFGKPHEIFRRD